ncbi:MAG: argininosuccinate lyase [Bacteroidia bacterium]|nr:argininosuccinate lyase [Bacteroidia bacterium]
MKLWTKETVDKEIEAFTIGDDAELDMLMAEYDVIGSLAHIQMLKSIGILSPEELEVLTAALKEIQKEIQTGDFEIQEGVEDIHSQVELKITERYGEVGKKIHTGRSRNDQVLVDIRLFLREEVKVISQDVGQLAEALLLRSEQHSKDLMPGYTHMQVAMLSSFGLWFGAYAESLADDLILMKSAYDVINQNPLGSAAGYGSSFPINRSLTTQLLGFNDLAYNSIHAQMGRGKTELVASFALAGLASTINKLASDICTYSGQNFGFFEVDTRFTTGSSIMPHKRNPDVLELMRAKCNQVMSIPNEIMLLTSNLPVGYHRDFQLLKEKLYPALSTVKRMAHILTEVINSIEVNPSVLDDPIYDNLYTTEAINALVVQGVAFRDAYHTVATQVKTNVFDRNIAGIQYSHEGSIGNLCTDKIRRKLTERVL